MENNTTIRRLGDFICEVNERNSNGFISLSQGICNLKYFQNPRQVSATPELDKIVRTGQFAYNRATTRNGDKISIALREGPDCTVSSAYCVFYITDENVIDPHWLWLWFKRPDFDRYAIFKSHGSAHEFFEFETMCNVKLSVPPIEEQRAIVARHRAIEHKIDVNHRLIAALEETARTIYRHTFIDNIDPENLPQGWRCVSINDVCNMSAGGDKPAEFSPIETEYFCIPIFSNSAEQKGLFGYTKKPTIKWQTVTISARGTIGVTFIRRNPYVPIVRLISLWPKTDKEINLEYLYFWLSLNRIEGDGAVQEQLTVPKLGEMEIILPPSNLLNEFQKQVIPLLSLSDSLYKETEILSQKLSAL